MKGSEVKKDMGREERKGQMQTLALEGNQENSSETRKKIKGMGNNFNKMEFI